MPGCAPPDFDIFQTQAVFFFPYRFSLNPWPRKKVATAGGPSGGNVHVWDVMLCAKRGLDQNLPPLEGGGGCARSTCLLRAFFGGGDGGGGEMAPREPLAGLYVGVTGADDSDAGITSSGQLKQQQQPEPCHGHQFDIIDAQGGALLGQLLHSPRRCSPS